MHGRSSRVRHWRMVLFAMAAIVWVDASIVPLEHRPVLLRGLRSDAPSDMPETHAEVAAEVPDFAMTAGASGGGGGGDVTISPPAGSVSFTGYPPDVVNRVAG